MYDGIEYRGYGQAIVEQFIMPAKYFHQLLTMSIFQQRIHLKKAICGILTEMSADMDQIHYVIVGIGINVQMTDFPKEIQNTATSLKLVTGKIAFSSK